MRIPGRRALGAVLLVATGYACGSGGAGKVVDAIIDVVTRYELNGGSLAEQLAQAGPPPITPGIGIAERVPEDGTRHFTLTVATENRAAASDSVAVYALMDAHEDAGEAWGANVLAFAHSDMRGGAVQGLEIDVGNLGTAGDVPVTGLNVFAIGSKPSDVAVGILNGTAAGPGGFREGIAFRSNAPGVAVTDALMRVHPGFGIVANGIDLRNATFTGAALATPGFSVDREGGIQSTALLPDDAPTRFGRYVCVDDEGRLFASRLPCRMSDL
jgi:hypothetical protein